MFTYKEVKKLTCSHTPINGVDEYLNEKNETIFIDYKSCIECKETQILEINNIGIQEGNKMEKTKDHYELMRDMKNNVSYFHCYWEDSQGI